MTIYIVFAGLGTLIYTGVVYAEAAVARFGRAQGAFGLQLAFYILVSTFLATVVLFYASRLLRRSPSTAVLAAGWRTRTVVGGALLACSAAILIGATREPGGAGIVSRHETRLAMPGPDSTVALDAGRALFQERGCAGCHRSNGTGAGPTLHGLFGSAVQYPASGIGFVDESYVSEAILNPSSTLAEGFPPIMPTFAGELTEDELEALVVYVRSLGGLVQ